MKRREESRRALTISYFLPSIQKKNTAKEMDRLIICSTTITHHFSFCPIQDTMSQNSRATSFPVYNLKNRYMFTTPRAWITFWYNLLQSDHLYTNSNKPIILKLTHKTTWSARIHKNTSMNVLTPKISSQVCLNISFKVEFLEDETKNMPFVIRLSNKCK